MPSINFKIYLTDESSSFKEVRRFIVDKELCGNYTYFHEKLQVVFPKLRGNNFTVYWKDNDGDAIMISSNEDLEIALNELPMQRVHKLYVTLNSERNKEKPSSSTDRGVYHHNIVCDGCEGEVRGFRYKCVQCEDYDLCHQCEAQGLHPEHSMIRISKPLQWPSHYNRRFMHHLRKIFKKHDSHFSKEDAKEECTTRGRRHYFRTPPACDVSSLVEALGSYINDFTNINVECPMKESTEKSAEAHPCKFNKSCYTSKQDIKNLEECIRVLKQDMREVQRCLCPFGDLLSDLEVQSDEEKRGTQQKETTKKAESQQPSSDDTCSSKEFPGEGKKLGDGKKDGVSPVSDTKQKIKKMKRSIDSFISLLSDNDDESDNEEGGAQQKETTKKSESQESSWDDAHSSNKFPEEEKKLQQKKPARNEESPIKEGTDEWTIVDKNEASSISRSSSASSALNTTAEKDAAPSAPLDSTAQNSIYPQLQSKEEIVFHANPKIQRAIETMVAMGFSNKGGLLTYLLEAENGNISKVLDLLQPSR